MGINMNPGTTLFMYWNLFNVNNPIQNFHENVVNVLELHDTQMHIAMEILRISKCIKKRVSFDVTCVIGSLFVMRSDNIVLVGSR